MSNKINPYIAGNPIRDPEFFLGRQDIVDEIASELQNQENKSWVLFGQRRVGKTSLLYKLVRDLSSEKYLIVYFDLQDKAVLLLGELLKELASIIVEKANLTLPKINFDDRGQSFQKKFLPWLFENIHRDNQVIILFDEFDVLDEQIEVELHQNSAKKQLNSFLRRLMSEEPRLGFIFVMGRYPEQIKNKNNLGATFKASLTKEIWLLSEPETTALVRLAEQNQTLNYEEKAIQRIYALTHGHPYFTQLFCQRLWQKAHEEDDDVLGTYIPTITERDVNNIVSDVMDTGSMGLRWIWDGLQPAEKLFASALAEILQTENELVTDSKIRKLISSFEARLSPGKIAEAPLYLKERRIIKVVSNKVDTEAEYGFAIEFFRLWLKEKFPLYQVKIDLDKEDKIANSYFDVGFEHYAQSDWQNALDNFDKAINKNPYHFNATLHKGKTLVQTGHLTQAYIFFQRAYSLDSVDARTALLDVLRKLIYSRKDEKNIGDALRYCADYLKIAPEDQDVIVVQRSMWEHKANQFFAQKNWAAAYSLFQKANVENYWEKFSQISTQEWVNNAEMALESGLLDDVSFAYEQAGEHEIGTIIAASPNETTAYYKLAEFYEKKMAYVLAKKALLRITERDADVVQALLRIIRFQIQELEIDFSRLDTSDAFIIKICLDLYQEMQILASGKLKLPKDENDKISALEKFQRHRNILTHLESLINLDDLDYYARLIEYLDVEEKLLSKRSKNMQLDKNLKIANHNPLILIYQNTEFCFTKIEAGIVYVGNDEKMFGIQTIEKNISYDYWLGKYPVTNSQFAWFDKSYSFGDEDADKPATKISWVRALEYCAWLQDVLRSLGKLFVVRLPNEVEWERAAKGDTQKKYPWGNDLIDETFCNFGQKYSGTTNVNYFPKGENTFGCWDMAGNVWEWTISVYDDNKLDIPTINFRKDVSPGVRYVCKGGAWDFPEKYVDCSGRYKYLPNTVQENLGFRILITIPSPK
jgi:AAA+ ATPase superfamily predicted ATPase